MNWLIRQVAKVCVKVSDEMKSQQIDRPAWTDWSKIIGSIPDGWEEADSIGTLNIPDASIEGRAKVGTEADDLTAKKWPADGPV